MDSILLATKLRIPAHPHQVIRRGELIDGLEQGVLRHKLVLVSAPAGYGKTTLLADWARSSRLPIAWLSVGVEDDDLERFFRDLLRAWATVRPDVGESSLGMLLGSMAPDRDAIISAFLNVSSDVSEHTVFVLDDYHLIEDSSVHQAMTFLLDHLPPTLHFVLAGRGEPSLPLARYRARHELLELRTEDLQFSLDEASDFLKRAMGIELADVEIAPLFARLEGWIAGLQLVSLTLRRRRATADELIVSGRHRFIADYLSDDVLAHLPDDVQRFLLQTSILERLDGALCDAVTGQADGQERLEKLERENLFLVPLDDEREWFRYHHLFADFLRGELYRRHPDEVAGLHRRAARWHLAHNLPEPAFRHAVAGEDAAQVCEIAERHVYAKLTGGEFTVVRHWLDLLPAEWYSEYPELGLARVALLLFTGQLEAGLRRLGEVEQSLLQGEGEETRRHLARVTAVHCFIACYQNDMARAETLADRALRDLPAEDLNFRPGVYGALGDTFRRNGRWEQAQECYLKALEFTHAPTVRVQSAHMFGALADLDLRQGHLQRAAAYWRKALVATEAWENWGRVPLPVIGWVYIRLSEILYEWNELGEARDLLSRGLARAELGGDVRALIAGYLLASRLKLAEGDLAAAADSLERARPLLENASFPEWTGRFERCQLELWLAQDRLRAAVHWADAMPRDEALAGQAESEVLQLAKARVLIIKGDAPALEQALALLRRLLAAAEAEGRMGILVETLALQALGYWQRGERASAMTSLERALRLAEPEGYLRLFTDLGLPLARVLQEARSRAVMPDYVTRLLTDFGTELASAAPTDRAPPEPLTQREQEILELLAAGLTNREIADKLVISSETVKKHTGTIYGKLGVGNRTEAAARARDLDLLG